MAGYLGSTPVPQATQHRESFTATSGQTTFASAGYTAGFVDVYLNGSHLSPADFTATNGSDVVLASGASADDVCDIISHSAFELNAQTFTGTTTMDVVTATGVVTANAGVVVDNFTLDGTTLALSSGNLTFDVAGNIILDSDGGEIIFKDGGVNFGRIFGSSANLFINNQTADKDITFQGVSGGADINALTLDMSAAGAATFNGTTSAPANASVSVSRVASQGSLGTAGNGSDGVVLQLNQETTDDSGAWNSSNYRFTALRAGRYLFNWSYPTNINNGGIYRTYLWKNGSQLTDTQLRNDSSASAASYLMASRSKIVKLAADDYIELRASSDQNDIFFADSTLRITLDICLAE